MDWNTGLKRISAVFWGFWALFIAGLMIGSAMGRLHGADTAYLFLCFPAFYAIHRAISWIIDGFFKKP